MLRHANGEPARAEALYRACLSVQPRAEEMADAHVGIALVLRDQVRARRVGVWMHARGE